MRRPTRHTATVPVHMNLRHRVRWDKERPYMGVLIILNNFILYIYSWIEYNQYVKQNKKGRNKMPTKPVKKTTAKTTTAKKTVTKKTVAAKKPTVKKTVKKSAPELQEPVVAPEMAACKCGAGCKCGENCACGSDCKCNRGGSRFGRFMIKLIMVLIIFALGFGAAKLLDCNEFRGPRVDFDDGCLDVSSVKCPELQRALPMMDIDHDGCITREEYRAVKTELHRQMRAEMRK